MEHAIRRLKEMGVLLKSNSVSCDVDEHTQALLNVPSDLRLMKTNLFLGTPVLAMKKSLGKLHNVPLFHRTMKELEAIHAKRKKIMKLKRLFKYKVTTFLKKLAFFMCFMKLFVIARNRCM